MGAIAPPDKAIADLLGGVGEWLCTAGTSCEAPPGAECSVVGARCSPGYEGEGFVPSSGLGGMLIKVESGSEEVAAGAALCPFLRRGVSRGGVALRIRCIHAMGPCTLSS